MNRTSARILAGTLLTLAAAAPSSAQAQVTTSGTLTWNANGSLSKLVGNGSANAANNVTCNYTHDDMGRLSRIDCGAGKWGQSYTYDAFGNLGQSPLTDRTGTTFQPDYSPSTNRYSGTAFSYDANGNLMSDGVHRYAWDAEGKLSRLDGGAAIIYDAFGRRVEQPSSTGTTQILYGADGSKLALMNGQTVRKAFVPLPGGATAVYNSGGLAAYRHPDWLGSSRLATTPSGALYYDGAYSPFGEKIDETGTMDRNFTGQNQDLDLTANPSLYDFPYREYQSLHGRWVSPDPAGIAAADPANPQSWNRYSYVKNDPLGLVDPFGLSAATIVCYTIPGENYYVLGEFWYRTADRQECVVFGGGANTPSGSSAEPGGRGNTSSKPPTPQREPMPQCNDADNNRSRFFQQMPGFVSVAEQLNVPTTFIVGLSSYESGWLDNHNFALNNLWGLTKAGGANLKFPSFLAGNKYFVKRVGPYVQGSQTIPDFFAGLKKEGYNSANPNYFSLDPKKGMLFNRILNIQKWGRACGVSF